MGIKNMNEWYSKMTIRVLSSQALLIGRTRPGHTTLYVVLLVLSILVLNGRPKFIFRPYMHIPWLVDVQHVEPLNCIAATDLHQWPIALQSDNSSTNDDRLTVAIVTARPEFKRLPLTLSALACHLDHRRVSEVIFLVPPQDTFLLEPFLVGDSAHHWPWPLSIMPDNLVLKHIHTDFYRLQMIFKLVLAQFIKTEFYLLLDSDCVAIWPIHVEHLLWRPTTSRTKNNHISPSYLSLYQIEERSDHYSWWPESEQLLKIVPNTCASTDPTAPTFGITPVILSKSIALRTLCRLQKLDGDRSFLNKLANYGLTRVFFGWTWTEYTLYYLTARCTNTFDTYHFHRSNTSSVPPLNFYGPSVWWFTDWTSFMRNQLLESIRIGLQWRRKEIGKADGTAIVDSWATSHNLFTVLQGRQNINPILYHKLFYPIFIEHLKQRHGSQQLVRILDAMAERLTGQ